MSNPYEGQDPLVIAQQAERDLNSHDAKHGNTNSISANESGVDESVVTKFPGSTVKTGSEASGREISADEGGDLIRKPGEKGAASQCVLPPYRHSRKNHVLTVGSPTKAQDFEGPGGPETKQRLYEEANPGNDDVIENVRQGTETRRP
ncbi:MAG: hypothetical protein Q9182_003288 [Xanthomendoza sp. 2 TL-2023]